MKKNQDSQMEGTIQKWKSLYRNTKTTQEQDVSKRGLPSKGAPGLKEAYKQLSLENFKLKKAQDDIQKEFGLVKVMSRHWRSQLDNLKAEAKQNKSYVVEILKKELEYLEGVYSREKKVADMWRGEVKQENEQKMKSKVKSWREFKGHWNKESKEDYSKNRSIPPAPVEDACTERGDCRGTPRVTSESNTQGVDKASLTMDYADIPGMGWFWGHPEKTRRLQDNNDEIDLMQGKDENKAVEVEEGKLAQVTVSSTIKDVNGLPGTPGDDENMEKMNKETAEVKIKDIPIKNSEENGELRSGWFNKEVMEVDGDIVVVYENKDIEDHKLFGFWGGKFREVCSSPGDVFVISMTKDCLDANLGFVVSVQNDSPQPIDFFAVLPNGKVKHQQITGEVKITMVHLGNTSELRMAEVESKEKLVVYEAIIGMDGKLLVTPQKDEQKVDDKKKNEEDNIDGKKQEESSSEETTGQEKPNPYLTVPKSFLQPGEAYVFEDCSGRMFRRIVSVHRYPISEYQDILSLNPGTQEHVFYRFPENHTFEKFVVREEVINNDGEEQADTKEKDEPLVKSTAGAEPSQYDDEIKSTVKKLLKNRWEDGNKVTVVMTYDAVQGILTTGSVTLWNVKHNEVISHEELRSGKIEQNGSTIETTSYHISGYGVVRIIQTDERYDTHNEIESQDTQAADDDNNNGLKYENSENEGGFENEAGISNKGAPEKEGGSKNNYGNEHTPEEHEYDYESASLIPEEESSLKNIEICSLELGESNENEYWTIGSNQDILQTHERVERVKVTPVDKVDDVSKLDFSSEKVEETLSYIYCGDGSVTKIWKRMKKIHKDEIKDLHPGFEDNSFHSDDSFCLDEKYCMKSSKADGGGDDESDDDEDHDNVYDDDNHDDDGELNQSYHAHPSNSEKIGEVDLTSNMVHGNRESYGQFFKNKWLHLKMHQRQFEISKKQNLRLQKKMMEEWKQMKEEYRSLQKRVKKSRKSEEHLENKRRWRNMKYQQQQFDNWKKQILKELKNDIKKEWEKLKKEQKELELREKQLNFERETFLLNNDMMSGEHQGKNTELIKKQANKNDNVDEKESMAWELADVDGNDGQMQLLRDLLQRERKGQKDNLGKPTKFAGKNIDNLQTASPDWSKGQTKDTSEKKDLIQPKCPVKCPKSSGDYSSEPQEEVILQAHEKTMKNGYALNDFILGNKYINKLNVNRESDNASEINTGPLRPKDKKMKAWKKKKRNSKYEDNNVSLFKKSKKKAQGKKQQKRNKEDQIKIQNQRKKAYMPTKKPFMKNWVQKVQYL